MSDANSALNRAPSGFARGVERERGQRVVGLAAEVELPREHVADVLAPFDAARRELVERVGVLVGEAEEGEPVVELVEAGAVAVVAELLEQLDQAGAVEMVGVVELDRLPVALLPVAEQVGVEARRPGDTALEEREPQLGEPVGNAGEEQRPGHRLARGREHADVVPDVARGRRPAPPARRGGVEGRGDAELDAPLPDRVVVVRAVGAERVDPAGQARRRVLARVRAQHRAAEHERLQPQLGGRELELGDRLVGRVHRDDADGCEPVGHVAGGVGAVGVGVEGVEGAGEGLPQVVVVLGGDDEPVGRVEDGVVDAELRRAVRRAGPAASRSPGRGCCGSGGPTTSCARPRRPAAGPA